MGSRFLGFFMANLSIACGQGNGSKENDPQRVIYENRKIEIRFLLLTTAPHYFKQNNSSLFFFLEVR